MKFARGFFPIVILLIAGVAGAPAQNAAIQQLQNSQAQMQMPQPELRAGTNAPELYRCENEDIGPQEILRVNKAREWPQMFDVTLDSQVFYSDNANYAGSANRIGSAVFVNTAQAAFAPDPFALGPGKFAPAAGFSCQLYDYSSRAMDPLDFYAETAFINLRYFLGNNWQIALGGNYTRLINQAGRNETYREWLPTFTLQRVFALGDHAGLVVGDYVDYHFTHVPLMPGSRDNINDHVDNMLFLAFNWQVNPHLAIQPFYRFQFSNYHDNTLLTSDRNDYLNAVGVNVAYSFNKYISARAFINYTTKTSDDQYTPTYDELNGGIGATLDIKF